MEKFRDTAIFAIPYNVIENREFRALAIEHHIVFRDTGLLFELEG